MSLLNSQLPLMHVNVRYYLLTSPGSHLQKVDTANCCTCCTERCVAL